jgi:hypothetical protein
MKLTIEQKAEIYDECLRESDRLQLENSKIKAQYVVNIPPNMQQIITKNEAKIAILVGKLESLFE